MSLDEMCDWPADPRELTTARAKLVLLSFGVLESELVGRSRSHIITRMRAIATLRYPVPLWNDPRWKWSRDLE